MSRLRILHDGREVKIMRTADALGLDLKLATFWGIGQTSHLDHAVDLETELPSTKHK